MPLKKCRRGTKGHQKLNVQKKQALMFYLQNGHLPIKRNHFVKVVHFTSFQSFFFLQKMSKNVALIIFLFSLFDVSLCCHHSPPQAPNYQVNAGLPNATSISPPSTTYNNIRSYGNNCGHNKYWNVGDSGFIVNGAEAYENEFPFLVQIDYSGRYCAGVIISS